MTFSQVIMLYLVLEKCRLIKRKRGATLSETILVVDDEQEIADFVELFLKNENFNVIKCYSGKDALTHIGHDEIDLAILDIMLPDSNGLSLCQKIREKHTYPIIMLTAKDNEADQVTGLTMGADDYITKPFKPLVLVAKVKAQLRRQKKYDGYDSDEQVDVGLLTHMDITLDTKKHKCYIGQKNIELTPTEFQILEILLRADGNVVSSEEMFHSIWEDEYYTKNNNTISVHIRHLREKLGDTSEITKYIRTVWGLGYKIEN